MKAVSTALSLDHPESKAISFLLGHAAGNRLPFAVWRLPGSSLTHVVIADGVTTLDRETFLEETDPGFVFAPFRKTGDRFLIRAEQFFTFENGVLTSGRTESEERSARWLSENLKALNPGSTAIPKGQQQEFNARDDNGKEAFLHVIRSAVQEIEKGAFEKVVPSRTRIVGLPASFDVTTSFQKLCRSYPQALISFVSIPGVGDWLGASPEILVCVEDRSVFKTVALAGTLPYIEGTDLKSVAWTQKEIEEQALVERYVISCFKKIRLREYEEHGPKTVIAGNLMHLKSEFKVDIKATNFPQIGTVMLDLLHPTSAVCGMPLDPALDFLSRHEPYDREFYAGYLGPVNIHNNIELFVNLRCMRITGTKGTLYAGAGVTADSVAEKEWDETEIKLNTLLNVIL